MAQYKLNYGNARGRGELIRYVFVAGGQEFTDVRFDFAEWPTHKPRAPFGQMPFLEVTEGGKTITIAQSVSIGEFVILCYSSQEQSCFQSLFHFSPLLGKEIWFGWQN